MKNSYLFLFIIISSFFSGQQLFPTSSTINKIISPSRKSNIFFHDTKGNIEVNGMGQLQFSLPIALPPGIKSVAPQINLTYTSGTGNGIAGYGWNISGITAISRIGKSLDKDGTRQEIQLSYEDNYSFNGQKLILVSGDYGKDGAIYTTEKYSNIKIKSIGTNSNWKCPNYWEVTFEDGSQAWYGSIANSKNPIEYNITKWKDAQGNYISYNYIQFDNVSSISSIQWGGNENLNKNHFNEIIFNYDAREFKESSYIAGVLFIQHHILSDIIVNSNRKQFKKYVITYNKTENSGYQSVKNITEYNSQNEPANPVSFKYEKPLNIAENTSFDYEIKHTEYKKYGDFDFDGIIDFIEMTNDGQLFFKKSIYQSTDAVNLSYNFSDFSHKDFSKATLATIKKNDIIRNNIVLIVPVEKQRGNDLKIIDYEFKAYSVNIKNKSLDFLYSKFLKFEDFEASSKFPEYNNSNLYCHKINSWLDHIDAYDYDGGGLSELVLNFIHNVDCHRADLLDPPPPSHSIFYKEIDKEESSYSSIRLPNLTYDNTEVFHSLLNNSDASSYQETKISNPIESLPDNLDPGIYTFTKNSSILFDIKEETPYEQSFYMFDIEDNKGENWNFADFNGDGIDELFKIENNRIDKIFNLKKDLSGKKYIHTKLHPNISLTGLIHSLIKGDFNGDGKVDFAIPQENRSKKWKFYISTGDGFKEFIYNDFIYFSSNIEKSDEGKHRNIFLETYCHYGTHTYYKYNSTDLDGDGKSEIIVTKVILRDHSWNKHSDSEYTNVELFVYSTNSNKRIGRTNLPFHFGQTKYSTNYFQGKIIPFSPIFINRNNQQIVLIGRPDDCPSNNCDRNHIIHLNYFNTSSNYRITSIEQGGLYTEIEYKELDPNKNPNFYSESKKEKYPYIELDKLAQSYVVSQLKQLIPGIEDSNLLQIKQDFRYRGFISHLQGKGIIGFRKTARSSWYSSEFEKTKVWSGVEIDPINEGVPIKEWSIKTNDEDYIFPSDLSFNNNQLLTLKTIEYKFDKLLDGKIISSVNNGNKAKVVTAIVPTETITKDFIKEVSTTNTVEYNEYYLPVKTIQNTNQGFAEKTTAIEYYPPNLSAEGKDYNIGRPKSKTELLRAYGDSKGAKEDYFYENNLLKSIKSWNNNNYGWVNETYSYDGFGNIVEKIISNSIDNNTQITKSFYEDKGRFVIQKIDNLGLITNITYNDWGLVLSQTDPLGNTLHNSYDHWGKLLNTQNNLSGTISYSYEKFDTGTTKVTEYTSDGGENISYTNKIGQTFLTTTKAFDTGKYISVWTLFDPLGRKVAITEPFYTNNNENFKWNSILYDEYSRPIKATAFTGKIIETKYSKNSITTTETNANNQFKKQTFDPLGNISSTEDKGGTIYFKYNANGAVTEAKYGTNIVTTKYDSWGRKIEYNDPSNGIYRYEYNNGFGLLTKEISPKGEKSFFYNDKGQLISQKEISTDVSNATDKTISFSYNSKGLIINRQGFSNGKRFSTSINYDNFGRVLSSSEENNGYYFNTDNIKYDDKNNIISFTKSLHSLETKAYLKTNILYTYSSWNGELYQIKDKDSNEVLWELNETNTKGQATKTKLGKTSIQNTYDRNGFLQNIHHTSQNKPDILNISYSFNAIKNELNSRVTGGSFNISESFIYDDHNRLVNWSNPRTGEMHSNKYDPQGRIIENDQLGTISFDDNKKVYQPTSIYLNSTGNKLFNYGHIENIAYNENNDPVFINGVKGDVLFEYGLTHMRQLVSFGGEVDNEKRHGRYTRYYSEDGTFEVTLDHSNGSEKSIIYIGGSPYESNIIYIKDFNEDSEGSYKFLHKDYLGSILAISDEKGDKLEQRHYDAWGNLTHLQIRDNEIISDPDKIEKKILLIDRGYTSHEHFQEVGIIHMNGRLYAPLLRRFLNADENIQNPYNTQNYNKYGYVLNNPLMYNDPSGEFVFAIFAALPAFWGAAATAAVIGATVGLASYTIGLAVTGNLDQWNIGGALKATLFGAISGAATFGLGELFAAGKVVQALGGVKFLAQAAAHGVSQGVLSVLQGGDFLQGFASGALGSLGAEAFGQIVGSWSSSTGGQIFFGALSGGVGAELTGGNFWQGAAIGGIVAGLNHVMHKMGGEDPIPSSKERTWYEKAVNFFSGGALDEAEWMLSLKDLSTVERGLVIGAHFSKQARYEFMYARGSRGMALGLKNNIAEYGVKSILNKAGALTRLKGNVKQGMLKGDANNIFKSMAKSYGAKIQNKGKETFFQTGNLRVGLHNSAKAQGLPTIHINDGGKIYKIRVTE